MGLPSGVAGRIWQDLAAERYCGARGVDDVPMRDRRPHLALRGCIIRL